MPELPDVESFRRRVESGAVGHRVRHTSVRDEEMLDDVTSAALARRLKGRRLRGTRRHGKSLFVDLEGDGWLVLHFGMTGSVVVNSSSEEEPDHARLVLALDDDRRLAVTSRRRLGRMGWTDDPGEWSDAHDLGPDALADDVDRAIFVERVGRGRATIKSALMDQCRVAGVGNVYSDEILFQAGLHPRRHTDTLGEDDWAGLYGVFRRVLRVTSDHDARPEEFPAGYLTPVREEGAACPRCGATIRRTEVSGRGTYYCPRCQRT